MLNSLLSDIRTFSIFILISFALLLFDNFGFLNIPKSVVQTITVPIQYGLYKTSNALTRQFEFIILARRASQENKALTEQMAYVLSENSRLRKSLDETQSLLEQQQTFSPQTFNMVDARPVGITRYLILDKGSESGIKVGQVVVYKDNLIGKVKEVSPKKSEVILSNDPDFKTSAFVSSASGKAKGVLVGQFGSEMMLDKVLHKEPLNIGDLVYTEGSEIEIPRGLILGQVAEIDAQDNQVFKSAKVKSMFDITNLDIVFVIIS